MSWIGEGLAKFVQVRFAPLVSRGCHGVALPRFGGHSSHVRDHPKAPGLAIRTYNPSGTPSVLLFAPLD